MLRHTLVWVAIFAVIALLFLRVPQTLVREDTVTHTFAPLVEVNAVVRQQFVEPIHDDRLVDGAIRGMMYKLDPYSRYIAPDELEAFQGRHAGNYTGVGVELGELDGKLTVVAPLEESPAARAGIMSGDVILSVDGRSTESLSIAEVEDLLVGPEGSRVTLSIRRPTQRRVETVEIQRGPVNLRTVRGFARDDAGHWRYLIDPDHGIGYIRVSAFHADTMREFEEALAELLAADLHGLVLDLRFNPGGLMDQAVAMVDRFVADGAIVSVVSRRQAVEQYFAHEERTITDLGLVLLINGGSGSSSEIVAGALQDHGRAMIVGERSFGKGSVQHLIPLSDQGGAIKLTVGYYRLPSGRIIHRSPKNRHTQSWGIRPDVEVVLSESEVLAVHESRMRMEAAGATLPGEPSAAAPHQIIMDRQLETALAILREPREN